MSEAQSVVTSENAAEFYANKLGLAAEEPAPEAVEEVEAAEPELEPESSEPEAESVEKQQEKKSNPRLEKRFSDLTKQRDLARQEADRERQAKAELESRLRELENKINPPAQVDLDEEPKPEQFRDAYEYAKALAEYSAEKAIKERDRQEAERRAAEERTKTLEAWNKRQQELVAELPDYEAMIASSDVVISDQVRDAILESEQGPRILYHLAENPELAEDLKKLSVSAALRKIGQLEARFERKQEEKPAPAATKSRAPAPISPLKGTGVISDLADPDKMSYQQWREARKAGKIR